MRPTCALSWIHRRWDKKVQLSKVQDNPVEDPGCDGCLQGFFQGRERYGYAAILAIGSGNSTSRNLFGSYLHPDLQKGGMVWMGGGQAWGLESWARWPSIQQNLQGHGVLSKIGFASPRRTSPGRKQLQRFQVTPMDRLRQGFDSSTSMDNLSQVSGGDRGRREHSGGAKPGVLHKRRSVKASVVGGLGCCMREGEL